MTENNNEAAHIVGRETRIEGKNGELVTLTARKVTIGDEIITSEGKHYKVHKIDGDKAEAVLLGEDNDYLALKNHLKQINVVPAIAQNNNWKNRPVGVYHTHTDESYLPSDGKSSEPYEGGIYDVGEVLASKLDEYGVNVKYYKTPHEPHDDSAYQRSRRTAIGLLKNNPVALFDIHRDGIPNSEFYLDNVNNKKIAQIRLVVGRQNPKLESNMEFARRIMASVNQMYPGLIKEIYKAEGNYNQDLLSTAVLLEVGTYTNNKEFAKNGVKLFSDALPVILGLTGGNGVLDEEIGRTGFNLALWLTLITLFVGIIFLIINYGWERTLKMGRETAVKVQNYLLGSWEKIRYKVKNRL